VAVVVLGDGLVDEAHAVAVGDVAVGILGIDDDEARLVELEMALDQRQRADADRAEADHHDGAGDARVDGMSGHGRKLQDNERRRRKTATKKRRGRFKPAGRWGQRRFAAGLSQSLLAAARQRLRFSPAGSP